MSHPHDAFTGIVHPEVRAYLDGQRHSDDPLLHAMEAEAAPRNFPLVGRQSGWWLELLTRSIAGRRVFEFGSGFGYSAWFFANAVGPAGEVVGSDNGPHEVEAHERLWAGHPLKPRVRIVLGSAFDVFAATPGTWDVVFIDIHKEGYVDALDAALPRVRKGGWILADNVLWGGKVTRPAAADDANTATLQAFNRRIGSDPQLQSLILPVGDGLAVCRVI
jgi:caffeoyl-CoA O-methyltransferase